MFQMNLFLQVKCGMVKFNHSLSFEVKAICVHTCCMALNVDPCTYSPVQIKTGVLKLGHNIHSLKLFGMNDCILL